MVAIQGCTEYKLITVCLHLAAMVPKNVQQLFKGRGASVPRELQRIPYVKTYIFAQCMTKILMTKYRLGLYGVLSIIYRA